MFTRSQIIVLLILMFILLIAAWSRLRHVDDSDHEPQRIRLEEHPAFRNDRGQRAEEVRHR